MKIKINILLALLLFPAAGAMAQSWYPVGSGTNGFIVNAVKLDSVTHDIYLGGSFTQAGGVQARYIARYNQTLFTSIGDPDNPVRCLEIIDDTLYAGGDFNTIDSASSACIAKWDGTNWHSLGLGFYKTGQHTAAPSVYAIAKYDGDIYAAGVFDHADSLPANFIARWDGNQWSALGTGMGGTAWVYDMQVFNGDLYVAGSFSNGGGVSGSANIARWNGTSWSSVGGSASGPVYALEVYNGELIAGGGFATIGGVSAAKIAKWNGFSWAPLGTGMGSDVNSLAVLGGNLYAGGIFTTVGPTTMNRTAMWNGTSWGALGAGTDGLVMDLEADEAWGRLYASGTFNNAGGNPSPRVAFWALSTATDEAETAVAPEVFPNPANEKIIVRTGKAETPVALTDLAGRVIFSSITAPGGEIQVEVSAYPAGIYLLSTGEEGSRFVTRIVIEK